MLIPYLEGGLGNIMFQLSATYSFAKQTGHEFGILDIPMPPEKHSALNYKDSILKPWLQCITQKTPNQRFQEFNLHPISVDSFKTLPNSNTIQVVGYWQNYRYIEPFKDKIVPLFTLNSQIVKSYSDAEDGFFLHVRRGDYVGNIYHELDLSTYYKNSIKRMGTGVAHVMSNDIGWCEDWELLKDTRHVLVKENEVDTLSVMAHCKKGGIAANSSFSWWGLYLNTNRPYLIIPSRWYPHDNLYQDGYAFPGTIEEDVVEH